MDENNPVRKKKKWTKKVLPRNIGRPTDYKPEYPAMLIDHMAGGESFWSFAAVIDSCFQTLANWTDPEYSDFHPEFLEAKRKGEAKLLREDEKIGRNGMKGHYEKFSATAWLFTMKNRYNKIYRDRVENVQVDEDGKVIKEKPTVIVNIPSNGRERKKD